ncbi:MAG: peptide chain release factor N(5)-glutamine methyltransferase [Terracidiphilus sp.]|jgi:release factor glutamine methyltransferase
MQPTSLSRHKVHSLIAEGEYTLAESPHPERARRDAETLLLHLFQRRDPQRNRAWLIAHWNNPTDHGREFRALIERRLAGEPIQHITGETEFYGLPFRVTPDVLIPRPETEHLVEKVLALAAGLRAPRIVDVGTGSGAIAVALAHKLPHAQITATDLSAAALDLARENAERNGVAARIRFLRGDLLAPVAGEAFDIIVSNPPYVSTADRASLSVEVRDYEPALALFAGPDGLDIYRRLIPHAFAALTSGGFLALEIGFGQSPAIRTILADSGFEPIEFVADLQNIPRVASAQRR